MGDLHLEHLDELLNDGSGPSDPTEPTSHTKATKQSRSHRRRQARLRGARCRAVLAQRGYRHAAPLIDALVEFSAISDKLPWPSQQTLAKVCGVTDRTIRHWLTICERLGLVEVFRSTPKPRGDGTGTWTRKTNRYLLCDRKAAKQPPSSPLRRRHKPRDSNDLTYRKSISSNPSGFEPLGVATTGDDPLQDVSEDSVGLKERPTAAESLAEASTSHSSEATRTAKEGIALLRAHLTSAQ